MTKRDFPPIHPGEILLEDFLKPMQISQYHLAQAIGVSPRRINEIVHGKRGVTADTALRLGRFFGMEAQFWMNLQTRYDLETTREALADRLEQEVRVHVAYTIQSYVIVRCSSLSGCCLRHCERQGGNATPQR